MFAYVLLKTKQTVYELDGMEPGNMDILVLGVYYDLETLYKTVSDFYNELDQKFKKAYNGDQYYGELKTFNSVKEFTENSILNKAIIMEWNYGFIDSTFEKYYVQKIWAQ